MTKRHKTNINLRGGRAHICKVMGYPIDTPIVDGKKDITFRVTKADLMRSRSKNPQTCGYAKALCRETGYTNIRVYRNTTLIGGKGVIYRYRNADDMRLLINKFDISDKMAMHDMVLKAPKGGYRIEVQRESSANYKASIASGKHTVNPRGPIDQRYLAMLRPRLMSNEAA